MICIFSLACIRSASVSALHLGQGLGSTRIIVSEKSSIAEDKPVSVCLLIKATDTDI